MKLINRTKIIVGLAFGLALFMTPSARAQYGNSYGITPACQDAIFYHEMSNVGLATGCANVETAGITCAVAGINWIYSVYKINRDCRTPPAPPPTPPAPKAVNYDPNYGYYNYYDPVEVTSYSGSFIHFTNGFFVPGGFSGPPPMEN